MASKRAGKRGPRLIDLLTGDLYEYPRKVRGEYVARRLRNTGDARRKRK